MFRNLQSVQPSPRAVAIPCWERGEPSPLLIALRWRRCLPMIRKIHPLGINPAGAGVSVASSLGKNRMIGGRWRRRVGKDFGLFAVDLRNR